MRPMANAKPFILLVVIVPFLGTVLAMVLLWQRDVHWTDLALLATMYTCTAFGQTIGYHRMLTHRSFRPHPVVKLILLVFGAMAVEAPPVEWAATHIKHHAQSDHEGDPHSPLEIVVFVNRTFLLWVVLSLVIPFMIGGWTGFLWGALVRIFIGHHVSFSVNSVCHTFGKREFETNDRSHNEWIVGLLAFGEGWHNNHHAFPRSAFHGLHWWQFDFSGYVIWTLERLGLVHDVYRVSPTLLGRSSFRKVSLMPSSPQSENEVKDCEKLPLRGSNYLPLASTGSKQKGTDYGETNHEGH